MRMREILGFKFVMAKPDLEPSGKFQVYDIYTHKVKNASIQSFKV